MDFNVWTRDDMWIRIRTHRIALFRYVIHRYTEMTCAVQVNGNTLWLMAEEMKQLREKLLKNFARNGWKHHTVYFPKRRRIVLLLLTWDLSPQKPSCTFNEFAYSSFAILDYVHVFIRERWIEDADGAKTSEPIRRSRQRRLYGVWWLRRHHFKPHGPSYEGDRRLET